MSIINKNAHLLNYKHNKTFMIWVMEILILNLQILCLILNNQNGALLIMD